MTSDLRELLRAAVPEPPSTPDRASGARERHRRHRRRTALAVAAAAAVAVAALAVVPAILSGDGDDIQPAPFPTDRCPPPGTAASGPSKLPDDPVAIRLCPGTTAAFDAPADPLVTGAQKVVALANTQPKADDDSTCESGSAYLLVFTYADGDTQVVPTRAGCGYLEIGSTPREDGNAAREKFLQLLAEQRAASEPPTGLAVPPECTSGDPVTSPIGRMPDAVAGVLCVREPAGSGTPVAVPVSTEDLAVLIDDAVPEGYGSPEPAGAPGLTLVADTAWGDTTAVTAYTDWWPGPQAQRVLDRLVSDPDAELLPAEVVAAYAALLNVGDLDAAASLWTRPPTLEMAPESWINYEEVGTRFESRTRTTSPGAARNLAIVTTRWRVLLPDATPGFREVAFRLEQADPEGPWKIVRMTDQGPTEKGR